MTGLKVSAEEIELLDNHLLYIANALSDIQREGPFYGVDINGLWQAIAEIRETLGLPEWE